MCAHIDLLKKWLKNPDLVTQKELDENLESAWCSWVESINNADSYYEKYINTFDIDPNSRNTAFWVKSCEELKND